MKRIFTTCFIFICVYILHAEEIEIDQTGYTLDFESKSAMVEWCTLSGNVEIPSTIIYDDIEYKVTSIGKCAFNFRNLSSIVIPNSVTSIGEEAFMYCNNLRDVTIPNSVISIGQGAFQNCRSLYSITIPESITSISDYTFEGCSLFTVILPHSVTSIGTCAFSGCGFSSIVLPDSLTTIKSKAFANCDLNNITIPRQVSSIETGAFDGCQWMTNMNVVEGNPYYDSREDCNAIIETRTNTLINGCQNTLIPNSVTSIGESAFYGNNRLTNITIPGSVTNIGSRAFFYCELLSIDLPNSLYRIEDSAFAGSGLTCITIPKSVIHIGMNAFSRLYLEAENNEK